MDIKDKRFIEDTFPIREVSVEGAKEKSIRHGHISTLHIWWARRPLATSRATNFAALIPTNTSEEEKQKVRNFIAEISKWENSNNESLLSKAREMVLEANGGLPPKVLDTFGGGGSIPLEALRLGCETYSNDYNPVAVLIQKCTLEYPQKYGKLISRKEFVRNRSYLIGYKLDAFNEGEQINPLIEDLRYFSKKILEETKMSLNQYYPSDIDNATPVGYLWAKSVPCQNPTCNSTIPLMRQFWLSKKEKKHIALYPYVTQDENKLKFKVVGDGYEEFPKDFDPEKGTISRAVVTCPFCGTIINDKTTRKLFKEGKSSDLLIAVILNYPKKSGKYYRIAEEEDLKVFDNAKNGLKHKTEELRRIWGIEPVPDEELPVMSGVFNVPLYGVNTWGKLFNDRQALSVLTFCQAIRSLDFTAPEDYKSCIYAYLALALDRLAIYCSNMGYWHVTREEASPGMQRQALGMVFDYFETIPIAESFSWASNIEWILKVIENNSKIPLPIKAIHNSSATNLKFPDNFFDAVFTDPPYYNSVPYADLSDFFYVWLKRSVSHVFPDLFSTPLAPKKNEITEMAGWDSVRYPEKDKIFFETNLSLSFKEIYRVLKPDGIATIVYAHKSTAGWETVINALLDSGLVITASWPLSTEMQERTRASESAALSSSIYIVARKIEQKSTGFYKEVKEQLRVYLSEKLEHLWAEGITGADFFIAAIGSAIEVFGKYEKVIDYEGNIKRADTLLDDVREIVMNYTVAHILQNGFSGEVSELTKFYVIYRFSYGEAKLEFDEANKLARSVGIDLSQEFNKNGFINKDKEFVRVLSATSRKLEDLKDKNDLIDVLHHSILLWESGNKDRMMELLAETGYGKSEAFFRVAQAISESLAKTSPDSREKKLLDGFLGGKERIKSDITNTKVSKKNIQGKFEF